MLSGRMLTLFFFNFKSYVHVNSSDQFSQGKYSEMKQMCDKPFIFILQFISGFLETFCKLSTFHMNPYFSSL